MCYFAAIYNNIMRTYTLLALCALLWTNVRAQTTVAPVTPTDTTIYDFVEELPIPMIARCVKNIPSTWTLDSIRTCAQYTLLSILSGNIQYPETARQQDIQGTVVLSYVVETNGKISNLKIMRDIGGGCGAEAVRVFTALDEAGLSWKPGIQDKKAVRVRQTMPLRFKLEETKPYYLSVKGDTIYTSVAVEPSFRGGMDSLRSFVANQVRYPKAYRDSCKNGIIEMNLLLRSNGKVEVDNHLDFYRLGLDFEWEALQLVQKSQGLWTPAQYDGKAVHVMIPLRVFFNSDAPRCKTANTQFDRALSLGSDAALLLDEGKPEEAIVKLNEALTLNPNNTEFLYYRGTAYLNLNKRTEACTDYNLVKKLLGVTWFESVRKLMCGY
jgi:TonB family protein